MKQTIAVTVQLLILSFLFTGCHVASRTSMYGSGGRTAYNQAVQNTTNQELLLNLVRLRYSDTPCFLEVNSVTTQFTSTSKLSPSIKMDKGSNPLTLGADFIWQNQPTIQYAPLKGKDFAIQLMHPLSLSIIQGLIYTGWDIDRVFRLLVQSMVDIPNALGASGPIPEDPPQYRRFLEVVQLLRHFQLMGQLQIGVHHIPSKEVIFKETTSKTSKPKKEGESKENAEEEEPKKVRPNTIQLFFPSEGEESRRLVEMLDGVESSKGQYILNMKQDFNERVKLGIMTRSLLSCMYYLSLGIRIPKEDILSGIVGHAHHKDGQDFNWNEVVGDLLTVYSSVTYPKNAYLSVAYRGHWFYIDDSDINSKRTFVLLQQIYNLQAKQSEKDPPLLSIPLAG